MTKIVLSAIPTCTNLSMMGPASVGALIANSGWGALLPTAAHVGIAIPLHTRFLAVRSG